MSYLSVVLLFTFAPLTLAFTLRFRILAVVSFFFCFGTLTVGPTLFSIMEGLTKSLSPS